MGEGIETEGKKISAPSMDRREAFNDASVRKIPIQVKGEETRKREEVNRREDANTRQGRSSPPNEQKNTFTRPSVDIRNRGPSPNVDSFFSEANRKFDSFSLPIERMSLNGASGRGRQSNSTSTSTSIVNGRKFPRQPQFKMERRPCLLMKMMYL
eukprot:TRINITY_DN34064_c0_g1_i1.p1 TRINITY_DN34064_c0_g1~~TRINITY_DN34064_c0_g1_i1.p1  ORF type:complete len:163 (-),score=39.32 TRINITY_DN34064_c0_g1_i1:93-557(-)